MAFTNVLLLLLLPTLLLLYCDTELDFDLCLSLSPTCIDADVVVDTDTGTAGIDDDIFIEAVSVSSCLPNIDHCIGVSRGVRAHYGTAGTDRTVPCQT